jgi:prepilin signal peptidase PulO-like enzyme (type II secretory pathway)
MALYVILFIIGTCFGSFLNVLVDRLPNDEGIGGRSRCDSCKRTLSWFELFPIVSFLILQAKCRTCRTPLSWYYPGVELMTGVSFVLAWHHFPLHYFLNLYPNLSPYLPDPFSWQLIAAKILFLGIVCCLIVMLFADLKYFIIPDAAQAAFAVFALGLFFVGDFDPKLVVYRLGAAVVVMAPMLLLHVLSRGRGLGFGDVKLAANLGLFMGVVYGFASLYFAFIIGALVGGVLLLVHKAKMKTKVPFGPFILLGMLISIFGYNAIARFLMMNYGF